MRDPFPQFLYHILQLVLQIFVSSDLPVVRVSGSDQANLLIFKQICSKRRQFSALNHHFRDQKQPHKWSLPLATPKIYLRPPFLARLLDDVAILASHI